LNSPNLSSYEPLPPVDEQELEVSPFLFPVERYKPLSLAASDTEGASYLARDRVLDSVVLVSVAHTLSDEEARLFLERAKELCKVENESSSPKLLNVGVTIAAIPYIVTQVSFDEEVDQGEEKDEGEEKERLERAEAAPIAANGKANTGTTDFISRSKGSKLAKIFGFGCGTAAVVSLVAIWAHSVLNPPGIDHLSAPVKGPEPVTLSDGMSMYEENKWTRMTYNGGTVYDAGPVNMDEDFAELAQFGDVRSLRVIRSETITGTGLSHINKLPLTSIQLDSLRLSDEGMRALAGISTLKFVGLGWASHVTDDGMRELTKLTSLESLSLDHFKLPETTISVIASIPTLTEVRIVVPDGFDRKEIGRLAALPRLRSIFLCACRLTDGDCDSISQLPHARELTLANNEITDGGVEQLARMPLMKLDLSGNKVTDRCLRILSKVSSLKELTIVDCPLITEPGKAAFLKARPKCWLTDTNDGEKRRGTLTEFD
jgi:hypothetical protein